MGLGNFILKKTAKSTAKSIAKFVNSGKFNDDDEALKAWTSTRRNSDYLVMMVDGLAKLSITPDKARVASTVDIAISLFYAEMDIDKKSIPEKVQNDIKLIFIEVL